MRSLLAILSLGLVLVAKTELYVFIKNKTPAVEDFKEFIEACSKETKAELIKEVIIDGDIITDKAVNDASVQYCTCMTTKIINRNIIKPYYNRLFYSQKEIELKIALKIEQYLETSVGQADVKSCLGGI